MEYKEISTNKELPSTYQALEYVSSQSSDCYIIIPFEIGSTDEITFDTNVMYTYTSDDYSNSQAWIFTERDLYEDFFSMSISPVMYYSGPDGYGWTGKYVSGMLNAKCHILLIRGDGIYISGDSSYVNVNDSYSTEMGTGTSTGIRLLTNGTDIYTRLYDFKVYKNEELALDLIPCMRISDSVKGLYDKISNTFYYPTTGELVAVYAEDSTNITLTPEWGFVHQISPSPVYSTLYGVTINDLDPPENTCGIFVVKFTSASSCTLSIPSSWICATKTTSLVANATYEIIVIYDYENDQISYSITPFKVLPAPITITGTGDSSYCYVTISGTTISSAGSYTADVGDTITLYASTAKTTYPCQITIDGTSETSTSSLTKTYTVGSKGCTITFAVNSGGLWGYKYGYVTVTTNS